jgi:hypothetical protein
VSTVFILHIPSTQQTDGETLIRGYVSNYAAQAGYSNAIIQTVTWANNTYTVVGNVNNAQQFQSGFALSSAYSNLLTALSPPSAPAAPSSIALPVGIAVGATALGIISAATAIYLNRKKRRQVSFDPTQPSTLNQLKSAMSMTMTKMTLPQNVQPINESYYDPEQGNVNSNFTDNVHLARQPSLSNVDLKLRTKFIPINNRVSYEKAKMVVNTPNISTITSAYKQPSTRQLVNPFMSRRNTIPPPLGEFDIPPPPPPTFKLEDEPKVSFQPIKIDEIYPPPPIEE